LLLVFTVIDTDEARLLSDVLGESYDKKLRPVTNKHRNVTVVFGLTLNQIMDVVGRHHNMLSNCALIIALPMLLYVIV
jgi:hypothetical protein